MALALLIGSGCGMLLTLVVLTSDMMGAIRSSRSGMNEAKEAGVAGRLLFQIGAFVISGIVFVTGVARYRHWSTSLYHGLYIWLKPAMFFGVALVASSVAVSIHRRRNH